MNTPRWDNSEVEKLEQILMDCCEYILDEFSSLDHLPAVKEWYFNHSQVSTIKLEDAK